MTSTAAHKIWEEQCAATERIRERFGLQNALDCLLGEKLVAFAKELERHPEFAEELPAFLAQIRRQFTAEEIRDYLDYPKRSHRSERRAGSFPALGSCSTGDAQGGRHRPNEAIRLLVKRPAAV